MINKYWMTVLAVVGIFGLALAPCSQAQVKYGQAGMTFLKLDVGVRSAGMGGTHGSVSGTAVDMFSNPAGIAGVDGVDAAVAVNNWIVDTKHYGAGLAYSPGNVGTFGLSLVTMDYGTFHRTVPYQGLERELRNKGFLSEGTFEVQEYAVGLSYARQVATRFFVGGQLRYARQNLGSLSIRDPLRGTTVEAENVDSNVILDFGTLYRTGFKSLRFGLSFRNFSNQTQFFDQRFELPLTFVFGVAMDVLNLLPDGSPENSALTMAVDAVHPRDFAERINAGFEYAYMNTLFLRGGYKFNHRDKGLTAGVGADVGISGMDVRADYSFSDFGNLFNPVHRVSLGFNID